MIIFDLEWNRSYDKIPLEEILQIGAVRLETLGGPITDTFNLFIRPCVHKKLNRTAKALPELRRSLDSQVKFPAALKAFLAWCGDETVFAGWGGDDFDVLRQNCAYWNLPALKPVEQVDLQMAFSLRLGTRQGVALSRAVEYCGIPDTFTFHNALNDAMYTALLTAWISPESLSLLSYPKEVRRIAEAPAFPPQPRRRVGPFPSVREALNNRTVRRQTCPVCGESVWVRQWYAAGPGRYFAHFRCRRHGAFLCRLTLSSAEDGRWQGRLAVPEVTPTLLREFDGALRTPPVDCRGSHTARNQRRRRKRRAARQSAPVPRAAGA